MAVTRQNNWLPQQRVDVPDLRSIESGVSRDFDVLAGILMAGKKPLIVNGFNIVTTGTYQTPAELLSLNVSDAILVHYGASDSGTVYATPATATTEVLSASNNKVIGSFTAGTTNYIGLDYIRLQDATTSDLTKFQDAQTHNEIEQVVPKARILDYRIVISTQAFSTASNIAPLAIVVTDANNGVFSIKDARNLMFRLGSGGDTANPLHAFSFYNRRENGAIYTVGNLNDSFIGGDKSISNLKDWMDAAMTSIWECKGGEFWYSAQNRDQVKMIYGPRTIPANSDNFYFNAGVLQWMGVSLLYENGNAVYRNDISDGSASFAEGQCLYVDLDRSQDIIATGPNYTDGLTANVTPLATLGNSVIPGRRYIIAWMVDGKVHARDKAYPIDRQFHAAGIVDLGVVRLDRLPVTHTLYAGNSTDSSPVVLTIDSDGHIENTAIANNATGFYGVGFGSGAGIRGQGSVAGSNGIEGTGTLTGLGGVFNGGSTQAAGLQSAGGANAADATTYTITNNVHTPGPSTGGYFLGGSGAAGGDGIIAFANSFSVPRHGVVCGGSNPHLQGIIGIACDGGDGLRAFGGPSTAVGGAPLSSGGYCYTGVGGLTNAGGDGLIAVGGTGSVYQGEGGNFRGGAAAAGSGRNGGAGISALGGNGDGAGSAGGVGIVGRGGDGTTTGGTGGEFYPGTGAVVGVCLTSTATTGIGISATATTGKSIQTTATTGYGLYADSTEGKAIFGIGATMGVEGKGHDAPGGSGFQGGLGVYGQGGAGDGGAVTGTGVEGSSVTGTGVRGSSTSYRGVDGHSVSGAGVYGSSATGPAAEFDGSTSNGEAIRIDAGEIVYNPAKTRSLFIPADDMVSASVGTGWPILTFGTGIAANWKTAAGGAAYTLTFAVHIPYGSVITKARILCEHNDGVGVQTLTLVMNKEGADIAGNTIVTSTIFNGIHPNGVFLVTGGAAKTWNLNAQVPFAVTIDNTFGAVTATGLCVKATLGAPAMAPGQIFIIYGVQIEFNQYQNSYTV